MTAGRKIAVIGNCGAGKTTFCRELGRTLDLEVVHLDQHYWRSNWQRPPKDEWQRIQTELLAKPEWIIDGNYHSSFHLRFPVATDIIFFDFPRWLCLWRALTRRFKYHKKTRPDLGGRNVEQLNWPYLKWILTYPRKHVLNTLAQYEDSTHIVTFKSSGDVQRYLQALSDSWNK